MQEEAVVDIFTNKLPVGELWTGEWPQTIQEFETFVDRFLDRMVSTAFQRLGNKEEAEDVVQDVFVKAYADRVKLRKVQRVGAYLYRMVVNACTEQRRRRKVLSLEEVDEEDISDGQSEVHKQITAAEEILRIEGYLRRLPGKQAEVIRLRILDEFSVPEIAEIVGCSLSTAKSRLHYGLSRLRRIVPFLREESE